MFRILALLAFLVNSLVVGAHGMTRDAGLPASLEMHMTHAQPQGDVPGHNLPDPVCKQLCLGMAMSDHDMALGHVPAPRAAAPLAVQAQVAGPRLALPDPPPKAAV